MGRRVLIATIFAGLGLMLLLQPIAGAKALAADKVGWVGPIYKELSDSLTKGFKEYYKKTYNKDVEITLSVPVDGRSVWTKSGPGAINPMRTSFWARAHRLTRS